MNRNKQITGKKPTGLVIKPFKKPPTLPTNFEEEIWAKLQSAISAIFEYSKTNVSREELCQDVMKMCAQNYSESLYQKLKEQCEIHIKRHIENLSTIDDSYFLYLQRIREKWDRFLSQVNSLCNIFLYLNQNYAISTPNVLPIRELCLDIYCHNLLAVNNSITLTHIVRNSIEMIRAYRNGENTDLFLLKNIVIMLSTLKIYETYFQQSFLSETANYFHQESDRFSTNGTVSQYITYAENRINMEESRAKDYLLNTTRKVLPDVLNRELIENHVAFILEGIEDIFLNNKKDELKIIYTLFLRIKAIDKLVEQFDIYIRKNGDAIVMDDTNTKEMLQKLLNFKDQLDGIVEDCFSNSYDFISALNKTYELVMNGRENTVVLLLASYCDNQMKYGVKKLSFQEMEILLNKIIKLFKLIQGKDIFEEKYKYDLAKRLLFDKSVSSDLEEKMISKLKEECGNVYTIKLEGIMKDIESSKDLQSRYEDDEQYKEHSEKNNIKMIVRVITPNTWPSYNQQEGLILPPQFVDLIQIYEKFYEKVHPRQKLKFVHTMSYCIIEANYKSQSKTIEVSLFQTLVLLLFNKNDQLKYSDIHNCITISDDELKNVLLSLACGKFKLLKKSTKGPDISPDEVFTYNKDFNCQPNRIKISSVQTKEAKIENDVTQKAVMLNRQHQIDALIVRIMKARKTLTHSLLIAELYNQLKFPVTPTDLKKRIESLIERDYLERDEHNQDVYKYLA